MVQIPGNEFDIHTGTVSSANWIQSRGHSRHQQLATVTTVMIHHE